MTRTRGKESPANGRPARQRKRRAVREKRVQEYAYVVQEDEAAFVLVPVDEYERLVEVDLVREAIQNLGDIDDPTVKWVDADDFAIELAGMEIAAARKAKGLTQKQLGAKLGLPQSQISRIERNPDHTTVRTLKRIARALGVDVSALIR